MAWSIYFSLCGNDGVGRRVGLNDCGGLSNEIVSLMDFVLLGGADITRFMDLYEIYSRQMQLREKRQGVKMDVHSLMFSATDS